MSGRLLVSALPGERRFAWLGDEGLEDLLILRDDHPEVLNSLYLGRVTRVDRGLAAAFVDIGLAEPGLLPFDEVPDAPPSEGDSVTVKVLRAPARGKGARLTARLKAPPRDLPHLIEAQRPPALLAAADGPLARFLAAKRQPEAILVDDAEALSDFRNRLAATRPAWLDRLDLDLDPRPLFEREGVEEAIDGLLTPRVELPSGGYLLVEPVRSLTAIDVNSGTHDARGSRSNLFHGVNLEAAAEIARQVHLRGLSGLIIIDFLEMSRTRQREQVVALLRQGLKATGEPFRVFPMAPSGLVEVTRRRSRPALHELLTQACGLGGGGRVKAPSTLAYEALRRLRQEIAARPGGRPSIEAPRAVIEALKGPQAPARLALEARLGRAIGLRALPGAAANDVTIVME